MAKTVNIKELAKYCGVSPATVSRVFSGGYKPGSPTRDKVLEAARKFNYTPQQTSNKKNIAIIIRESEILGPPSWFAGMLVNSLLRTIYKAGYSAHLCESGDIELLQPNFIAAAVSVNWMPTETAFEQLVSQKKPVIAINSRFPFAHSVCTDHEEGIRLAMRRLIECGHRRIGFLNIKNYTCGWGEQSRDIGYRTALEEAGIPFDPLLVCYDAHGMISLDGLSALLRRDITALVCAHEDWAAPLRYYLDILGKRIPDDLSVITAEVPGLSEWMSPPYSTIAQNTQEIAEAAVCLIQELIDRPEAEFQHRLLPYRFIERNSIRSL